MASTPIFDNQGSTTWDSRSHIAAGVVGAAAVGGIAFSAQPALNVVSCESTRDVSVGKESDFMDGELYEVPVGDDRHVLLSRYKGKLYAVGSRCSHYGYPLVKGVKSGKEVVCALHDASFDLETGKPVRGPGLDAIPTYPVYVKQGEVFVSIPTGSFPAKVPMVMAKRDLKNKTTYVIVGGGPAGLTAAETLRYEGFTGRIVLLSAEAHLPIDRPVLTKKLPVRGKIDGLFLRPMDHFVRADIEVQLNTRVSKIDPEGKLLFTDSSEPLAYDKCLIATGGAARELFIPGAAGARNVFLMRTLDDALAINECAAGKGQKVIVVGGSFIGMELASTLIQKGADVTIVSKTTVPYEKVLGKKVGAFFANLLEERKVTYIGNSAVKILRREGQEVNAVELDDGDVLPADAVVIGAGVVPSVPLGLPLASDGSIRVGPLLNMPQHPTVYAAGDVCTFPYVKTGTDLRVEHWDVAIQQGRVAAKNMMGTCHLPYNEIPFFWTMVFGKSLRYVGTVADATSFDSVLIEGDLSKGEFVAYYFKNSIVAAVATVGRDPVAVACHELMRMGQMPSPTELQLGTINSEGILKRLKEMDDAKKRPRKVIQK